MKLVITRDDGIYVSAEQHARVTAAIKAELAATKYTFEDAQMAWMEHIQLCEIEEEKMSLEQDQSEKDEKYRFELTDADRKYLATPATEMVTLRPNHEERLELWTKLGQIADEAAGESVWFYPEGGEYGAFD